MSTHACPRRVAGRGPAALLVGGIGSGLLAAVWGCAAGGAADPRAGDGGLAIAAEPAEDEASAAPPDFSVDLLILAGDRREPGDRVETGPIRLLISADGGVHADPAPRAGGRSLADRVRTVDRVELGRIWSAVNELGWMDPAIDAPPVEPELVQPAPRELLAVVLVTGEGRRRSIVARADADATLPEDIAGFARRLAALAWIDERSPQRRIVVPRRYDLGADPHERYRRGAGAADASDGR
jgi:hypothetical protein